MPTSVLHPITRLIVGGAQENTMYTAALLDKQHFQAEILSGPQTGSEGSLIEEVRHHGIPLTILPDLLRQLSPIHDLAALWNLYRLIRQRRFTIVHTHSSKAGILGRIAARLAGVPVIIHTVHGWSFHDHMPASTRSLYILLERLCAIFTHRLIAVAQKDIDKGLAAGIGRPKQYILIRSAIPLEEFDPASTDRLAARQQLGLPAEAPVLGYVGRFSAQKNPLDWVRVAGKVERALPDCRFLLVGDGPLRPQVEQALRQEGIAERTVLAGLRRDVACCMSAMDVFLLTSLWEGLPRVIPQAMLMGLPVIANQVDGAAEVIQPGVAGYLYPPGALDEMAAGCLELLQQPALRQEMGTRGQAFARQEFDLRMMVRQIEGVYMEELAKHG